MKEESTNVIFFADVVGSTKLYETLGDTQAHQCISEGLAKISEQVDLAGGRVIEVIGDEVMALFADSKAACECACSIQKYFTHNSTACGHQIAFRIGFHKGALGFNENGHPFGDTINVAARVAALARAGESITTSESVDDIEETNDFLCQPFGRVRVKGKSELINTMKVEWDVTSATKLMIKTNLNRPAENVDGLELFIGDQKYRVRGASAPFTFGRDTGCSLVVNSDSSSRIHLSLDVRFGKWFMTDRSTNGTYIRLSAADSAEDKPMYLHHSEWGIEGEGYIGLGKKPEEDDPDTIKFVCSAIA